MNHKWNDNTCTHCGIKRVKREGVRFKGTYSKLGNDGCFHDVPIKEYFIAWLYTLNTGDVTFTRPDCVRKNDDRVQGDARISEANSC